MSKFTSDETRELGPIKARVEWVYDDSPDTSYLGEGTDKPSWEGPVYDRWTDEVWIEGMWYDRNGRALTESDYDDTHADAAGNRREYRYIEGFQHSGTAKDYDDCPQLHPELLAKHASLDQASRSYVFADADRLKGLWNESWWMMGCRVTLTVDGEQLASDSLWGIDSDNDADYFKEVEDERIAEALAQAADEVPKLIDRITKLRAKLEGEVASYLAKATA